MDAWLKAALKYIPEWLDYQMRRFEQPGCVIAVTHKGRVVLEHARGHADAVKGKKLTPRHRFRVASHSKSIAAAAIMKLREQDRLRLDDPLGQYLDDLHEDVAAATLMQVLSHSAGLIRDGLDAGQWQDARPFADERELRAAMAQSPVLPGQQPAQVFQPRLWPDRPGDRGRDRRTLRRLGHAQDHEAVEAEGEPAGRAGCPRRAFRLRAQQHIAPRPSLHHSR